MLNAIIRKLRPGAPTLQEDIFAAYFRLRRWIAIIAFAFPLVLPGVGWFWYHVPPQHSLSAYYHGLPGVEAGTDCLPGAKPGPDCHAKGARSPHGLGPMRNWFVGTLFIVGTFLVLYRGFSPLEDRVLSLAGLCALGVATNPMPWPEGVDQFSLHTVLANALFVCLWFAVMFTSGHTLEWLTAARRPHYRHCYQFLGWWMLFTPIIAETTRWITGMYSYYTILIEASGIWAFAYYWWKKNEELQESNARAHLTFSPPPSAVPPAETPAAAVGPPT